MPIYLNLILSLILSLILISIGFINIVPYKLSIKEYISMIFSITLCVLILYITVPFLSTLPVYFVPIVFIYKFNHKFIKSFLMGIFLAIVIILIDNFIGSIFIYTLGESFVSSNLGYTITCISLIIALYIVTKFIGKLITNNKDFFKQYNSKYVILLSIIILITFALFYFNINWNKSSDPIYLTKVNGIIFVSYGIVMTIICFLLLFFIKKENDFRYKQIQLENLTEYTEKLEILYNDMRKFRHDYINIISTMGEFIEKRDMDSLEEHFSKHIYPLNNKINENNYRLGLLNNLHIPEIKGLVSAKVIHAQECNINVFLDIAEVIDTININLIDLSRIIGILLDNAIEAAVKTDEKEVNIGFIHKNDSIIIIVTNSFNENIPSISKLFKEGFSTKGDNRGLGLSNLKEITNKYQNILLDTSINKNKFYQEITIYNK